MATQTERTVVYAAGMVQGIALVTFPAASTILTDPAEYDLSSTQYGTLFLPQVITAITAALLGSSLGGRIGTKRVYLVGLAASLAAMALLLVSSFLTGDETLAYVLLLLATACLGAGFGFAVPALNTFTAAFNPGAADRSILVLNALLGLGTVLAPVFVAIFDGLGFWWGLPLVVGVLLVLLLVVSFGLPLAVEAPRCSRVVRAIGDSAPLLGVRGLRRALRHLRDGQRQLVAAGHDSDLGASTTEACSGADGVLGDGDPRASPLRRGAARRSPRG